MNVASTIQKYPLLAITGAGILGYLVYRNITKPKLNTTPQVVSTDTGATPVSQSELTSAIADLRRQIESQQQSLTVAGAGQPQGID